MGKILIVLLCISLLDLNLVPASLRAQEIPPNFDESKVPDYTLPDPLACSDGTRVSDATAWYEKRRPEILQLFTEQVYGKAPGRTQNVRYSTTDSSLALNGLAIRKQVNLTLIQGQRELTIAVLLYLPTDQARPVPAFLGLNFNGNHSITDEPQIVLNPNWMRPNKENGIVDNHVTETSRGTAASRWPLQMILKRGYAVVTAYYGDIDPDFDDGFQNGVHALFQRPGQAARASDEWGSISAWAWGLSRIMDYLETDPEIDHRRVVVLGHSRLGKTALWAGAQDTRFSMVISNDSGCGGAALSRRCFGETVRAINESFPHWFCQNFKQYNGQEDRLPVDQHLLLALIAPRPVYVASAQEDLWADPRGEFLALQNASPVYRLLDKEGLAEQMPAVNQPLIGTQSYHIRSGKHDVTAYDWEQYLTWADRFLENR